MRLLGITWVITDQSLGDYIVKPLYNNHTEEGKYTVGCCGDVAVVRRLTIPLHLRYFLNPSSVEGFCHYMYLHWRFSVLKWFLQMHTKDGPIQMSDLQAKGTFTVETQWHEHRWLIYNGWFELLFQSLQNSSNSSRKQIFRDFFLILSCMLYVLIKIASSRGF